MILRENHISVLAHLNERTQPNGEMCTPFSTIMFDTGLDRGAVRVCCRYLAKRGLAEFYRGLVTDEGEFAGSGYCITKQGQKILQERWRPIKTASTMIVFEEHFPEIGITIRNSKSIWARDIEGREFEAVWTDHKGGYWFDLENESPVDPIEWKPFIEPPGAP